MDISAGKKNKQYGHAAGALVGANPLGQLIYVNSSAGNDGHDGHDPRRAKASIFGTAGALSVAEAGDTIVCEPGGTEAITAAQEISTARVRIVCPADSPEKGYAITSSADADAIQIDAAGVVLDGLLIAHSGTTTNRAGIKVLGGDGSTDGQTGQQAVIKNCVLNAAGTAGKTDRGIELVGNCDRTIIDGCEFLGCGYGVILSDHASDTDANLMPVIRNCRFLVGASGAFGVYSAASNAIVGLLVDNCEFLEADGDGTSATAAWDGSTTAATQGPIELSTAVDQGLIRDCAAYSLAASSFDVLCSIPSGCEVDIVRCHSGEGGDIEDKVDALVTAMAVVDAFHDVATANSTTNTQVKHVVGNKTDTAVTTVGATTGLVAYIKGVLGQLTCATADSTTDTAMKHVVGKKSDAAVTTVGTTASILAYIKGVLNAIKPSAPHSLHPNYLTVTADFSSATWASVASHEILTVSGMCRIWVVPEVTADVGNDSDTAMLSLGTDAVATAIIGATTATDLDVGEIWQSSTAAENLKIINASNMKDVVVIDTDVGYTIGTTATTAGSIKFHCWWLPMETGATVAVGAGGTL